MKRNPNKRANMNPVPDTDPLYDALPSRSHPEAILIACLDLGFVPPMPAAASERDPDRADPDNPDLSPAAMALRALWAVPNGWTWESITRPAALFREASPASAACAIEPPIAGFPHESPITVNCWRRTVSVYDRNAEGEEELLRRDALITRVITADKPDTWAWNTGGAWHPCATAYACMQVVNKRTKLWSGA